MGIPKLRLAALALTSGILLSGCAYGLYDDGYGYGGYGGYGPYSRSGVSIGIGYGSGYGGYYGYGGYPYGGYGYGYGSPYGYGYDPFGWYGNYYYPGTGIYVYDRYRTRRVWTDDQRRYWEQRRQQWRDHHSGTTTATGSAENWSGWDRSNWRNGQNGPADRSAWSPGSSQSRTSVTSSGGRARSSGGGQSSQSHSPERAHERPN